jgi:CheY-like chemotaxis protein
MNKLPVKTVLYVDDDPDDRELITEAILEADNTLTVHQEGNAKAGLHYLQECKTKENLPCLIILDMNMPQLDGKQATEMIKADSILSEIPLILFTTSSSLEDQKFCTVHNIKMVTKPSSLKNLSDVIRQMLDHCIPE